MIVNHIPANESSTYNLDNSLEKWVLDQGSVISTASGDGLYQDENFHNDIIQINGTITQTAKDKSAIDIRGSITDVTVGATGSMTGYIGAVFYETKHDSLINHGTITATGPVPTAVSIGYSKNFTMESDGTINGCVYVYGSDKVTIHLGEDSKAYGAVGTAVVNVVNDTGAHTTIVNDGLMTAETGYRAVDGRDGVERVINHGKIIGGINLDAGNDYFDTRAGKMDGNIYMGEGNDTVLISKPSAYIYEDAGEGTDTVKANCSYTLTAGSEIEYLRLLGSSNFKAGGNELDNHILGNTGNNRITGFAGTDILTGGKGADVFVFADGFGTDTVTDFHRGADTIDLSGLTGVTGFKDLMDHHVSVSNGNLVITAGTDTLTLNHTTVADLHGSDFHF